jgi:hypothetical protein
MNDNAAGDARVADAQHPWLGLASFTEENRAYFHGREEEIGELARRVQRKLLTVLFGKSGLGKTSILRAGVVPRLSGQGYSPVYVRIDYSPDAPRPSEQIKQAIYRATQRTGQWTQPGVAAPDESPWEFLHHRDDVLHDAGGAPLIPLLIFDQFEEVFTLGQTDDAGRRRAQEFLRDLADLVENRPPAAIEARMEADESWAERFDFARSDYRVLLALREDYVAHLESLKADMPGVTQNRMRLAPMTGEQALLAVTGPGGPLVTREVAEAIVRFVAGGAELRNAEVEPSLLSLICRELNDARVAAGRREISLDLLEGTRAGILGTFYERALADQPPAVRRIIEDQLLTESGYRESVAEERFVRELAAAGAAPGALALLVDRRLLRIEERLDVRRVELTHDVLCDVVRSSRDLRKEREVRAAAERQLAEQRERARAARHALVRARQVAAVCAVLAVGAVGASIYAVSSSRRAHAAEVQAQETRAQAEEARAEAERLVSFLMDDFAVELEPVGQKSVIAGLDKRVIDYYNALPVNLQNAETRRNRAIAQVAYAAILYRQSEVALGEAQLDDAVPVLERLYADGDHSDATVLGLAKALSERGQTLSSTLTSASIVELDERAVALLEPLAARADVSVPARLALGTMLTQLAYYHFDGGRDAKAAEIGRRAMDTLASIGARDLSYRPAAAPYGRAAAWTAMALIAEEHTREAAAVDREGLEVVDRLLERQPGHLVGLYVRDLLYNAKGSIEEQEGRAAAALAIQKKGEADLVQLTRLDPSFQIAWNNLGASRAAQGFSYFALGDLREAAREFLAAADAIRSAPRSNAFSMRNVVGMAGLTSVTLADLGDRAGMEHAWKIVEESNAALLKDPQNRGTIPFDIDCMQRGSLARVDLLQRRPGAALARARSMLELADRNERQADPFLGQCRFYGHFLAGEAQYQIGQYAAAERDLDPVRHIDFHTRQSISDDEALRARALTLLAVAQARQGHASDAAATIGPVVKFLRELHGRVPQDVQVQLTLGTALFAQALADAGRHDALLAEAAGLIDGLPAGLRAASSTSQWLDRVAHARDAGRPDPDRPLAATP